MEYELFMFQNLLPVGLALTVKNDTLFHYQHRRYDVPENPGSTGQLDSLAGGDVAFNVATDDANAYLDLRLHLTLLSQEKRVRGEHFTAKSSVQSQRPDKCETAFSFTAVVDDRRKGMIRSYSFFPEPHNFLAVLF
jgi:hypothetical protein